MPLCADDVHTAGRARWVGSQRRRGSTRFRDLVWRAVPKRMRSWTVRPRSVVIALANSMLSVVMVDSSILAGSCNLANNEQYCP